MISKYAGTCYICKEPTKAGVDEYDLDTRRGYHAECTEGADNPEALAIRLGYMPYTESLTARLT